MRTIQRCELLGTNVPLIQMSSIDRNTSMSTDVKMAVRVAYGLRIYVTLVVDMGIYT